MFDEPEEESSERTNDPAARASEKVDEALTLSEMLAVFEGCRKFDAQIRPGLDADLAREIQRGVAKLEKAKMPETPVIKEEAMPDAIKVLTAPVGRSLSTNDYHVHRRPGEVMIIRWLAGDEVETFYERLQAHFDVNIEGTREDERQALEWKQDPQTLAYLEALDKAQVKMSRWYFREFIREHRLFILSTQAADEININYLADSIMNVTATDIVGAVSAPPDEPTEKDLAWFYKMFSLRGIVEGVERMCFFTFLQKTDDSFGDW